MPKKSALIFSAAGRAARICSLATLTLETAPGRLWDRCHLLSVADSLTSFFTLIPAASVPDTAGSPLDVLWAEGLGGVSSEHVPHLVPTDTSVLC